MESILSPSLSTFHRRLPSKSRSLSWRTNATETTTGAPVRDIGSYSILGTSRKNNEDRFDYQFIENEVSTGEINTYAAVFDGHGGSSVSERLEATFPDMIEKHWSSLPPEAAVKKSYNEMDRNLLKQPPGFFGMFGERGVGGSRCGATAATAFVFCDNDGSQKLLAANIGDSRVVLIRNGTALQLTEDHVPDSEEERIRIEKENPNRKMPLVRYVEGTWRIGGMLALSRAFGDAYMKSNLQFEGVDSGSDYSTGFGLISDPYTSITTLRKGDSWLLIHSDGLNNTETRGGGGGLSNEQIAKLCEDPENDSADKLAKSLANAAQEAGSTDDVTVVCIRLSFG
eukprot:g1175.t1